MFFLYTSMLKNPQQPPAQPPQNAQAAGDLNADPLLQEQAGEVKAEVDGDQLEGVQNPALSANPEQIVTLGSMDPSKDFNLLVAISSRGAGSTTRRIGRAKETWSI